MNKNVIIGVVLIGLIVVALAFFSSGNKMSKNNNQKNVVENSQVENKAVTSSQSAVKEFTMTSFTDMVNGEPKPQFSLKEISVNKGDRVRIKITEISGTHDFKIDEFGVYTDTPLNKESVVEFTADKVGQFVYYCTKPGHRANGQWGALIVK